MAIPDFQQTMLPLLRFIKSGSVYSISEVVEQLAKEFMLSEEERREGLPSGTQLKFENRVGWARTYMKKAGLLVSPERGKIQITDRGLKVLKENLDKITSNYLRRFPEFKEFRDTTTTQVIATDNSAPSGSTPEEILEESFAELLTNLENDLLENIKTASPKFFEQLVIDLLLKMGYGGSRKDAGERLGRSGDGGIDGIIKEDKLGLDVIYIQAKRWENTVGRPVVQEFVGSLAGKRAKRGILITTSQFSREAQEYASSIETKIVLIDGDTLAKLMIENNVGVSVTAKYELRRIDTDYFSED